MTFTALIVACFLLGLLLFFAAIRRLRRRRITRRSDAGRRGTDLALGGGLRRPHRQQSAQLPAPELRTAAGELQFTKVGERQFNAS